MTEAYSRRTVRAVAAAVVTCAACAGHTGPGVDRRPPVTAGVRLDDDVVTYPVEGRTVGEVRVALARAALRHTGTFFHGLQQSTLSWRWQALAPVPGGCAARGVEVVATSRITVPRWTPTPDAEPGLAERWAAYDAALRVHERGHEALAVDAAGALVRTLRGLRPASCAFAPSALNAEGRRMTAELAARERAYDDSTGHGRTQGAAWLPPAADVTPPPDPRRG